MALSNRVYFLCKGKERPVTVETDSQNIVSKRTSSYPVALVDFDDELRRFRAGEASMLDISETQKKGVYIASLEIDASVYVPYQIRKGARILEVYIIPSGDLTVDEGGVYHTGPSRFYVTVDPESLPVVERVEIEKAKGSLHIADPVIPDTDSEGKKRA